MQGYHLGRERGQKTRREGQRTSRETRTKGTKKRPGGLGRLSTQHTETLHSRRDKRSLRGRTTLKVYDSEEWGNQNISR